MQHDHGDFYHGPSFQIHPGDFLRDTQHLENDEVGAYMLLLFHAWDNFGIPSDPRRIARIGRVDASDIDRVWGVLKGYWKPHPSGCQCLINAGLEKRRAYAAARAENAKKVKNPGESETNDKQNEGITTNETETNASPSTSTSTSLAEVTPLPAPSPQAVGSVRGRQPSLPLDYEKRDKARSLLSAVWDLISAKVKLPTTKTEWSKQNGRIALSMVEAGVTPEQCREAWRLGAHRLGEPIRTMRLVQAELERLAATKPKSAFRKFDVTPDGKEVWVD